MDFYWAAFANIFDRLDHSKIPMDPERRPMFEQLEPEVRAALAPPLLAHRDWMMTHYFRLPMEF